MKWRRFFTFLASRQGKDGAAASEQTLELGQLQVRPPCGSALAGRLDASYSRSLCPTQDFLSKLGAKGDFYGWFTGRKEQRRPGYVDGNGRVRGEHLGSSPSLHGGGSGGQRHRHSIIHSHYYHSFSLGLCIVTVTEQCTKCLLGS